MARTWQEQSKSLTSAWPENGKTTANIDILMWLQFRTVAGIVEREIKKEPWPIENPIAVQRP